jgi:phosphatidylglycerophosphatase A
MFTFLKLKLLYLSLKKYLAFAKNRYTWVELFVSFGGAGYLRPAAGTWGSLAALPFAVLTAAFFGPWAMIAVALTLYLIAVPAVVMYEKRTASHDSSTIVIDEVIGMFITLTPVALWFWSSTWTENAWAIFLGFIIFRALDAFKPGPIGWVDQHMTGAHGVLLDDALAGVAAAVMVIFLQIFVI